MRWMPCAASSTRHAQRLGHALLDGSTRQRRIETHGAADEVVGVEQPEHDRGIRDGRLGSPAPVAGRSRIGARRLGADPEAAAGVDPRDRAAAGAERRHVEHRHANLVAGDVRLGPHQHTAAIDQGDIARGAADVDGDEVVETGLLPGRQTADGAGCGSRQEQPHRPLARDGAAGEAAARLHDLQRRGHTRLGEIALHVGEIAADDRLHVGIEGGDDGALVLAKDRIDLAGERDRHARHGGLDGGADAQLVHGIEEREEQRHRHGLDTLGLELVDGGGERRLVERHQHFAGGADALTYLDPPSARRQPARRLRLEIEVVHLPPDLPADLENVAEALGGDEADTRALAFQHGIGRDGGAVREAGDRARRHAQAAGDLVERSDHRAAGLGANRRHLEDVTCGRRAQDHVRERAADVDTDADAV